MFIFSKILPDVRCLNYRSILVLDVKATALMFALKCAIMDK